MARDEGFAVADTATDKLDDPKFRRLWRELRDESALNAAVVLHEAVTLKSWATGERVMAEDAAPFWMVDYDTPTKHLQSVGLLDATGKLPAKAWRSWFGPAYARREKRRENGEKGGRPPRNPAQNTETDVEPEPNQSVNDGEPDTNPVRPSVPSVPTEPSAPYPAPRGEKNGSKDPAVQRTIEDLLLRAINPRLTQAERDEASLEATRLQALS